MAFKRQTLWRDKNY